MQTAPSHPSNPGWLGAVGFIPSPSKKLTANSKERFRETASPEQKEKRRLPHSIPAQKDRQGTIVVPVCPFTVIPLRNVSKTHD